MSRTGAAAAAAAPLALVAALAALFTVTSAVSSLKFTEGQLPLDRLPTRVRPLHYDIDLDFSTQLSENLGRYAGKVNITVEFAGPDSSWVGRCFNKWTHHAFAGKGPGSSKATQCTRNGKRNQIVMHSDEAIFINTINVYKLTTGGQGEQQQQVKALEVDRVTRDKRRQLLAIDMVSELPLVGSRGLIEIYFAVRVRYDNHGVYMSSGQHRHREPRSMAAMFQPTFARTALPCFDEPQFKATFSLNLEHNVRYQAYANTELLERKRVSKKHVVSSFKKTPPMSIHMFAFTLGEFDEQPLELQVRDNLRLRAITMPGKREFGAYALEVAKFAIEWFEKYIDFKYPLEKLDIVASPNTATGNSETWGLVFVDESFALVDEETKPDSRVTTAVNVAHVVVHQWFANLVTAEWWDDMWITESVAAQMAFEIVAELFPGQSEYLVRMSTLSSVLAQDSAGTKHALSPNESELTTSDRVHELFDNIQFMKSGALAQMLRDIIGADEFRAVLRKLVRVNAYGNVMFSDLIGAIESDSPLAKTYPTESILSSWSKLKGYPVVNVAFDRTKHDLVIYEEAQPNVKASVSVYGDGHAVCPWTLPLQVLMRSSHRDQQDIRHVLLWDGFSSGEPRRVYAPHWFDAYNLDWVKVSPRPSLSTYYRVRYSDDLLRNLREAIKRRDLGAMDRIHLLDDSLALAARRLMDPNTFKELLGAYEGETDPAVVLEMLLATQFLATLDTKDLSPSPASQVFTEMYKKYGFTATGEETLLEQRARTMVLRHIVQQGQQEVVEAAVKAYDEADDEKLALFLREPVYAAVVAYNKESQVRKMLAALKATRSHEEAMRLASALAMTRDEEFAKELENWLEWDSELNHRDLISIHRLILKNKCRRGQSARA